MSFKSFAFKAVLVAGAAGLLASGAAAASAATTAAPKATAVYDGYGQALSCCTDGTVRMTLYQTVPKIPESQLFSEVRDSHGALVVAYHGGKHTEYLKATTSVVTDSTLVSSEAEATQFYAVAPLSSAYDKFRNLVEVDARGYNPSRYTSSSGLVYTLKYGHVLAATTSVYKGETGYVVLDQLDSGEIALGQLWAQGS